jgi:hypothetical protein
MHSKGLQRDGVSVGSVVQIQPSSHDVFGGCLMVVDEVLAWGVCGFVLCPRGGGRPEKFYFRSSWATVELVGKIVWKEEEFASFDVNETDCVECLSRNGAHVKGCALMDVCNVCRHRRSEHAGQCLNCQVCRCPRFIAVGDK